MFIRVTGIPVAVNLGSGPVEAGRRSTPQRSCDMRTWMKVLGLAVVLVVGGGLRADDDKKRTSDKPGSDDKARTDDRRSVDKRADDKHHDDNAGADEKEVNHTHFLEHGHTAR